MDSAEFSVLFVIGARRLARLEGPRWLIYLAGGWLGLSTRVPGLLHAWCWFLGVLSKHRNTASAAPLEGL